MKEQEPWYSLEKRKTFLVIAHRNKESVLTT